MRASAQQAALRVLAASEDFPRHGVPGGCTLEAAEAEEPKLLKNEGLLMASNAFADAVAKSRRQFTPSRVVASRNPTASSARDIVKGVARTPDVSMLVEFDRDIAWPTIASSRR